MRIPTFMLLIGCSGAGGGDTGSASTGSIPTVGTTTSIGTTVLPTAAQTQLDLCVLTDGPVPPNDRWPNPTITGTVIGEGPLDHTDLVENQGFNFVLACGPDQEFSFLTVVEDATGATWHIGWRSRNLASPLPMTAIPVAPGDTIEVTTEFWSAIVGGVSMLTIERQGELRFVSGHWSETDVTSVAGFGVARGVVSEQRTLSCPGVYVDLFELEFEGDTSVVLASDEVGIFEIGGVPLNAINLGTWAIAWSTTYAYCGDFPSQGWALAAWARE